MYRNSSPKVVFTAFVASSALVVALRMIVSRKLRGKKWTKMSTNDFSFGDHSFLNVGPLYIEPCKIARRSMPSHPHVCPSNRPSPPMAGSPNNVGTFSGAGLLSSSTSKPMSRTRAISSALFWAWKTKLAISSPRSSIATVAGGASALGVSPQISPGPCSSTLTHRSAAWRRPGIVPLRKKMETNLFPPRVVTSRLTAMRSSMRRPGSGLRIAAATSFDGRMNFTRQEQRAPSPRQSVAAVVIV